MVIRSTHNWDQYLIEVREHYLELFPKHKKHVDKFMEYFENTYKENRRAYFPYKYGFYLYRRKQAVEKNQHLWIAFIGQKGGEGKSTLGKQTLHFLDNSFHSDTRTAMGNEELLKVVVETKKEQQIKFPSILYDEMDISTHHASKDGRDVRQIITKIRQLNLCIGICANSLTDVPRFIYERLSVIIFINDKHRFWLWDKTRDKPKYTIIDDIKNGWRKMGHAIFQDRNILSRAVFKNLAFSKELPFKEEIYAEHKEQDLMNDIHGFLKKKEYERNPDPIKVRITKADVVRFFKENNLPIKNREIAELLQCSGRNVRQAEYTYKKSKLQKQALAEFGAE